MPPQIPPRTGGACPRTITACLHNAAPHAYADYILSCQSAAPFCGVAGQLVIIYLSVTTQVIYRIMVDGKKVKLLKNFRRFGKYNVSFLCSLTTEAPGPARPRTPRLLLPRGKSRQKRARTYGSGLPRASPQATPYYGGICFCARPVVRPA